MHRQRLSVGLGVPNTSWLPLASGREMHPRIQICMRECTRGAARCMPPPASFPSLVSSPMLTSGYPRRRLIAQPPILSSSSASDASFEAVQTRCGRCFGKCTTSTSLFPKTLSFFFLQHHFFLLLRVQQHSDSLSVSHSFIFARLLDYSWCSLSLLSIFITPSPHFSGVQNKFLVSFVNPFSSLSCQRQES